MQPLSSNDRRSRRRRGSGFILLYTLWMLLGGVVLLAALSAAAISRSRSAASDLANLQVGAALETAVHISVFELLTQPQRAGSAPVKRTLSAGGFVVLVEAVDQGGLLDVNAASEADVAAVFGAAGLKDFGSLASVAVKERPILGLWHLARALKAEPQQMDCLAQMVTFSSGLSRPEVRLAPESLIRALGLESELRTHQGIGVGPPGSGIGYVIHARTDQTQGAGGELTAVAVATGRIDRPVLVLDWHRHSSTRAACG